MHSAEEDDHFLGDVEPTPEAHAKPILPGGDATGRPTIDRIRAVRLVCNTSDVHSSMVDFYRAVLGRAEDEGFGNPDDLQRSVVWRLREGLDLIISRERAPGADTFLDPGPVWICFETENADGVYEAATERGLELLNDPIKTGFDTRAFYANDPSGLAVYVGGSWPRSTETTPSA